MKFKHLNFNELGVRGLSIFVDGVEVAMGGIGEVLR